MDREMNLEILFDKGTSQAFEALKEMEAMSNNSAIFYGYIEKFLEMIGSDKYVIRCRGFRMYCKQAKWDTEKKIDQSIGSH